MVYCFRIHIFIAAFQDTVYRDKITPKFKNLLTFFSLILPRIFLERWKTPYNAVKLAQKHFKDGSLCNLPNTHFLESPMLLSTRLLSCGNIRKASNQYAGSIILRSFTCNVRWGRITPSIFQVVVHSFTEFNINCSFILCTLCYLSLYMLLKLLFQSVLNPDLCLASRSNKANLKLCKSCQIGSIQLVQRIAQVMRIF